MSRNATPKTGIEQALVALDHRGPDALNQVMADAPADWPEAWGQTLGGTAFRAPLALLLSHDRRRRGGPVRLALALLALAPPDDRELAPGLTERTMALWALSALAQDPPVVHPSKIVQYADQALLEELRHAQGTLYRPDETPPTLRQGLSAWLGQGLGFQGTEDARRLVRSSLRGGLGFENSRGLDLWADRSLEDVVLMGRLAAVLFEAGGDVTHQQHPFQELLGFSRVEFHRNEPPARRAIERLEALAEQHPLERGALTLAATRLMTFGLMSRTASCVPFREKLSVWERWAPTVRFWVEHEPAPDELLELFPLMEKAALRFPNAPGCADLAQRGPFLVQQQRLQEGTPRTPFAPSGRRL